jgi:hypothetical protein
MRVGSLPVGCDPQQRDLEGTAPGLQQRGRDLVEERRHQLREPGEGERGLGLDSPADQDVAESSLGLGQTGLPEGGLPDAGLAREHEDRGTALDRGQKGLDAVEFVPRPIRGSGMPAVDCDVLAPRAPAPAWLDGGLLAPGALA